MLRRAALALLLAAGAARADVVLNLGNAHLAGGDMVVQTPELAGTLLAVVVSCMSSFNERIGVIFSFARSP